jgi:hypothetical protein
MASSTPDDGAAKTCHTHHAPGETCRCLSAITRDGAAEAGAHGNICRVPAKHS